MSTDDDGCVEHPGMTATFCSIDIDELTARAEKAEVRVAELVSALVDLRGTAETLYIRSLVDESDPEMKRAFATIATASTAINAARLTASVSDNQTAAEPANHDAPVLRSLADRESAESAPSGVKCPHPERVLRGDGSFLCDACADDSPVGPEKT